MEQMYCGKIAIDYDRDENFSAQALKLLTDYYMLPDESSPQEAFARAADCQSLAFLLMLVTTLSLSSAITLKLLGSQ